MTHVFWRASTHAHTHTNTLRTRHWVKGSAHLTSSRSRQQNCYYVTLPSEVGDNPTEPHQSLSNLVSKLVSVTVHHYGKHTSSPVCKHPEPHGPSASVCSGACTRTDLSHSVTSQLSPCTAANARQEAPTVLVRTPPRGGRRQARAGPAPWAGGRVRMMGLGVS